MTIQQIIEKITTEIINPTIYLLFGIATIVFVYGIVLYIASAGQGKTESGKKIMVGGIIGLFVMASAYGIVKILCDFFGNTC